MFHIHPIKRYIVKLRKVIINRAYTQSNLVLGETKRVYTRSTFNKVKYADKQSLKNRSYRA